MSGTPITTEDRNLALDVVRGFAVCGLAPMNSMDFAFDGDHYFTPGGIEGFQLVLWHIQMVLGSGKFMALFAMLFGAGLVLGAQRREAKGLSVAGFTAKRLGWLWFFGCLHGYLVWYGDILVTYAVTGLILFWCRKWGLRIQAVVGLVMLGVIPLVVTAGMIFAWAGDVDLSAAMEEEVITEFDAYVENREKAPRWDTEHEAWVAWAMHGTWAEQMPVRALYTFFLHLLGIPFLTFWLSGGLMLIGMALFQSGFFEGRWRETSYRRLAWIGILGGAGACMVFSFLNQLGGWNWAGLFVHLNWIWWGTPLLALGYAAVLVRWCREADRGPLPWLKRGWAAMGRMAFSNYIGQTVSLSLIYYGHGLGLRGQLSYIGVMGVALALVVGQMAISVWWLKRFRQGPLEALWRRLTYGKVTSAGPRGSSATA